MRSRTNLLRIGLLLGLAGAIAWVGFYGRGWDESAVGAPLGGLGLWAPAAFVVIYAFATLLFFPGSVLTLAGGGVFGPFWGTLWNLAGATLGASLAFLLARYAVADFVRRRAGERLTRMIDGVEAEGWRFVALVRLVPLFPFNLLNYALGLTRIRLATYIVTSAICMVPGVIAYTWLGHAGRQVASGNAAAIRDGLLAIGLLAAVAFIPRIIRRFREKPEFIDAPTLQARLDSEPRVAVIDVRGADEFEGVLGHIAGARNITLADLPAKIDGLGTVKTTPVVTVCMTDQRSSKAAQLLKAAGFERVWVLRGGMQSWTQAGFTVERGNARGHYD